MKNIFFIDLDGTLLKDNGECSTYTLECLTEVLKLGHEIIICSGRALCEIPKSIQELKIRYYVCSNGSLIWDNYEKNIINKVSISKKEIFECLKCLKDLKKVITIVVDGMIISEDTIFSTLTEDDIANGIDQHFMSTRIIVKKISKWLNDGVELLHFNFNSVIERDEAIQRIRQIKDINYTFTDSNNLQISSIKCSKGNSLKYFDLEQKRIISFGDSSNDISIFKKSDIAIAMKNASNEAKRFSTKISDCDNNSDGVAKEIVRYL